MLGVRTIGREDLTRREDVGLRLSEDGGDEREGEKEERGEPHLGRGGEEEGVGNECEGVNESSWTSEKREGVNC